MIVAEHASQLPRVALKLPHLGEPRPTHQTFFAIALTFVEDMLACLDRAIPNGFGQGLRRDRQASSASRPLQHSAYLGDESVTICGDQTTAIIEELEVIGYHGARSSRVAPFHEDFKKPSVRRYDLGLAHAHMD